MKILAVCGFGVGSSMVLKMSIEKVLKKLQINAEVDNTDMSSAKGIDCDVIFTSEELQEDLKKISKVPVYAIKKYMDIREVEEVIKEFLDYIQFDYRK